MQPTEPPSAFDVVWAAQLVVKKTAGGRRATIRSTDSDCTDHIVVY